MKPRILNFGSINIDHVYQVPHFVKPGETLSSIDLHTGLGGKGANQSVAIANAGVAVEHFGRVSKRDAWAVEKLAGLGVGTEAIQLVDEPSGHAIVQVDPKGENAIVLHGGANQSFEVETLARNLAGMKNGDYLLLQNECNLLSEVFDLAGRHNIKIAFNPAPMTDTVRDLPLSEVELLMVNQIEAEAITGHTQLDDIINGITQKAPRATIVITLGSRGAVMVSGGKISSATTPVDNVLDTTAAGDTFVGYFIAGLVDGMPASEALARACQAAAVTVGKPGAIDSIPLLKELDNQ